MKSSLIVALLFVAGCAGSLVEAPKVTPAEVQALMQKDSNIVLLDVRSETEYGSLTGHLAKAILIPTPNLEERLGEIEPHRSSTIVVYCQKGGRSVKAGVLLKAKGFKAVNMDGGMVRWNAENRPVIKESLQESEADHDTRMKWWREARFGLFIHWGLYAIPAGEWKGKTEYGEWIRHSAQIPLEEYDKFVGQFNPVKFDPRAWVRMAKDAGMKYIVITSKHHDGFCLFDSKETDFDVKSTPFKRDILKELSEACTGAGIKLCFYHSIMDWHHPDYLPRRPWEKDVRPAEGADFDRYVAHMKRQLKELVTNYGQIGVLWFDGEWESTWNEKYGLDLYQYVRSLQPSIIINNRVGAGREGMAGITKEGQFGGDFGTPEQEVPATGLPGVDWETCMTMNNNWGYNKNDQHWKSAEELIRTLSDVASKGGNFLLNVGPTAEGVFPDTSIGRLKKIGEWMKENGESIYGTTASPFRSLPWGRCTKKEIEGGTRLYLHVFNWPADGKLAVPGLLSEPKKAYALKDNDKNPLQWSRKEDAIVLTLENKFRDPINTVVVLETEGEAEVADPPAITADQNIFIDQLEVSVSSKALSTEIRYTLDGSVPSMSSPKAEGPIRILESCTVTARLYLNGKPVSAPSSTIFSKVKPLQGAAVNTPQPGVEFAYFEGEWDRLPDFRVLTPAKKGTVSNFVFSPRFNEEHFAFEYRGYIRVPTIGVYTFSTSSDDGSRLYIADSLVVDNDGLHGMQEAKGVIALSAGYHRIRVTFFEKTGGDGLKVYYSGAGNQRQEIPDSLLFR